MIFTPVDYKYEVSRPWIDRKEGYTEKLRWCYAKGMTLRDFSPAHDWGTGLDTFRFAREDDAIAFALIF